MANPAARTSLTSPSLPMPKSLSPSKVAQFQQCPLAFRFASIDRLPQKPKRHTFLGTTVHAVLEELYWAYEPNERTPETCAQIADATCARLSSDPEWLELEAAGASLADLVTDVKRLSENLFVLENPASIHPIGTELTVAAHFDHVFVRGIIDRLERTPEGDFVVVDYKTGKPPSPRFASGMMSGVEFYATACEAILGVRPVRIELLYLAKPIRYSQSTTNTMTRSVQQRAKGVWTAIEKSAKVGVFRPNPSKLCDWCDFRAYCPAQGGTLPEVPQTADQKES